MSWVSEEQVAAARKVDLLTYLQEREPDELIKSAPGEYRTVTHSSLVISKGAWYWNRGQFGGVSAIDYLIKIRGMGFVAAVESVCGICTALPALNTQTNRLAVKREDKILKLPPRVKFPSKLLFYLQSRNINPHILQLCMDADILYEGRYNGDAVCVFVGRDKSGKDRFGCVRGINSDMKRDCAGSDKRFGFTLGAKDADTGAVAVFEAPIDLLSHATLFPDRSGHRLSLGGTSPVALIPYLVEHPEISHVSLCLDADDAGQTAAGRIREMLAEDKRFSHITVTKDPPKEGKDFNDMLLCKKERETKLTGHRKEAGLSI